MSDESTIETLKSWSHVLLWVSVVLPFLGAVAAGARYYVERTEKRLSSARTGRAIEVAHREAETAKSEAATARNDAGDARAHATEARKRQEAMAAELAASQQDLARLRLETSPRQLSPDQRAIIVGHAKQLRGTAVAVACRLMDGESCDYATEIAAAMLEGGMRVPQPLKSSLNDFPGYIVVAPYGDSDPVAIRQVLQLLRSAGLDAREQKVAESTGAVAYRDIPYVIVGRKKP